MKNLIIALMIIFLLAMFITLLIIFTVDISTKAINLDNIEYDGIYKNKNAASWKISGDKAMMGLDEFYPSNDILLGTNIKDGVKYLTYKFADGSGNYTIEIWYGKQLIYKDKDYKSDDRSNKFYKK